MRALQPNLDAHAGLISSTQELLKYDNQMFTSEADKQEADGGGFDDEDLTETDQINDDGNDAEPGDEES